MSVAATVGALLPETVGETKTKPSGSDSVATTGLLPWLTKAVTTTPCSARIACCLFTFFLPSFIRRDALKGDPENAAKCRKSEENREKHFKS